MRGRVIATNSSIGPPRVPPIKEESNKVGRMIKVHSINEKALESAANVFMSWLADNNRPTNDTDRQAARSIVTTYLEAVGWWAEQQDSKAIAAIRQLPRYVEEDVRRRPSTCEYIDAESLDEVLSANDEEQQK